MTNLTRRSFAKLLAAPVAVTAARIAMSDQSDSQGTADAESNKSNISAHGVYFGWVRDLPRVDIRQYQAPAALVASLPAAINLKSQMPDVYDQKKVNSCTSNALAAMIQFVRKKHNQPPDFKPSRLFLYFNGRYIGGTSPLIDTGLAPGDAMRALEKYGVCAEDEWQYDGRPADPDTLLFPAHDPAAIKPGDKIYQHALLHRAIYAFRLDQDANQLKGCLAQGYPFMFGFTIYRSFWGPDPNSKPRVQIPLPPPHDTIEGYHTVVAVGYNDKDNGGKGYFYCRNSWGESVQENGYFYIPYDYLTNSNLSADFWTLRTLVSFK